MERLGGQLGSSANLDYCNVSLSALKRSLDAPPEADVRELKLGEISLIDADGNPLK